MLHGSNRVESFGTNHSTDNAAGTENVHNEIGTGTSEFAQNLRNTDAAANTSNVVQNQFDGDNPFELVDSADQSSGERIPQEEPTVTQGQYADGEPYTRTEWANGETEIANADGQIIHKTPDGNGGETTVSTGPDAWDNYTETVSTEPDGTNVFAREGQSENNNYVTKVNGDNLVRTDADGRQMELSREEDGDRNITSTGPDELDNFTAVYAADGTLRVEYANGNGFERGSDSSYTAWGEGWEQDLANADGNPRRTERYAEDFQTVSDIFSNASTLSRSSSMDTARIYREIAESHERTLQAYQNAADTLRDVAETYGDVAETYDGITGTYQSITEMSGANSAVNP